MFLSRAAAHVRLVVRGQSLAASMSDYLSSRLLANQAVTIEYGTEVARLCGDGKLETMTLRSLAGGAQRVLPACAVFVMIGAAPNTGWLSGVVDLDANGFVLTGDKASGASEYATSHPGIFAVGDVRAGSVKRVASSVGEGSVVISKVWEFLRDGGN
jgi:thioredoxin reductase (NADPH)